MNRHPSNIGRRHAQRGQSLVGMMVGLIISLLTIAAMLVLYKTVIEVSGNASRSALRDGQVASALLAAQVELQEAGFGVPMGDALPTRLAVSSDGKQVSWRFKPEIDAADQCAGLRLADDATGSLQRGLYRMPPKDCSDASATTWEETELQAVAGEAAFFEPTLKDGSAFADDEREVGALTLRDVDGASGYRFVASNDTCMPFRQQDTVELVGQRVTLRSDSDASGLFSVCLPNLAYVPAS